MTDVTIRHWREITPSWILLYEEAFLQGLAATLGEGARVVNIGAGAGTSSCALLRGLIERDDAQVLSIDIDAEMLEREKKMADDQGLETDARLIQIEGESAEVATREGIPPLDLVFVDGAHDYAGVSADLEAWVPHLKEGGLLVLHDYGDPRQAAMNQAIRDWDDVHQWMMVGRALFCVAFLKPGGDAEWRKGRL